MGKDSITMSDEDREVMQHGFWSKAFSNFCSRADTRRLKKDDAERQLASMLGPALAVPCEESSMSSVLFSSLRLLHAAVTRDEQDLEVLKQAKELLQDKRCALMRPFRVSRLVYFVVCRVMQCSVFVSLLRDFGYDMHIIYWRCLRPSPTWQRAWTERCRLSMLIRTSQN